MQICYEDLERSNAPFQSDLKKAVAKVLDSGWYVLGDEVSSFERQFADYHGAKECVSVASGLDALKLSLIALDCPKGSEVIVPSNAYIADILAIKHAGLVPVLVEPSEHTYNLDPTKVEAEITDKTKAILPVHFYGKSADMPALMTIAKKYNLGVVEDAAQAHGAEVDGQKVGTLGDMGAFSFYPTKNLGGFGDGGAIITNDPNKAQHLRALRDYGATEKNHHTCLGYNSRLDAVQAAMLKVKLKALDDITAHKRQLANIYFERLPAALALPVQDRRFYDVFHIFGIRHPNRDALKKDLLKRGIQTAIHYPVPIYDQPVFKDAFSGEYQISDMIHSTILSLPISMGHTKAEIEVVCNVLNEVLA